jgi:ribosomal protein L11 methyltransferase
MLELFPGGIEEREQDGGIELAAYTDAAGEARMRTAFDAVTSADVAPGWEERWRDFHHGAQIGPLWVGPPWEQAPDGIAAVVIEPGRAFGTGAHPTTRLCLELLASLPRGSLLDVGCGSGVLAVAAARLGFAPVYAVDNDAVAVATSIANAAVNGVEIEVFEADALAAELQKTTVAVANLTLETVEKLVPRVRSPQVVTSGYLVTDEPEHAGRKRAERRELDGWAADLWTPE